jgi:hypothetical protein
MAGETGVRVIRLRSKLQQLDTVYTEEVNRKLALAVHISSSSSCRTSTMKLLFNRFSTLTTSSMKASIDGFWINWSITRALALCTKEDLAKSNSSLVVEFDFS